MSKLTTSDLGTGAAMFTVALIVFVFVLLALFAWPIMFYYGYNAAASAFGWPELGFWTAFLIAITLSMLGSCFGARSTRISGGTK